MSHKRSIAAPTAGLRGPDAPGARGSRGQERRRKGRKKGFPPDPDRPTGPFRRVAPGVIPDPTAAATGRGMPPRPRPLGAARNRTRASLQSVHSRNAPDFRTIYSEQENQDARSKVRHRGRTAAPKPSLHRETNVYFARPYFSFASTGGAAMPTSARRDPSKGLPSHLEKLPRAGRAPPGPRAGRVREWGAPVPGAQSARPRIQGGPQCDLPFAQQ
jgi:hypothetical protein